MLHIKYGLPEVSLAFVIETVCWECFAYFLSLLHLFFFFLFLQSVLPFFVVTKMTRIKKPTLDKPTPERYVAAELTTVGLQSQTNGYFPHAVMVRDGNLNKISNVDRCAKCWGPNE